MLSNTTQASNFAEILIKDKPIEQYALKDPFGELLLGKIAKKNAWGRQNLFPVCMSNSFEFQLHSPTYPAFQVDSGSSVDRLARVTPVSQTSRLKFDGFLLERLRNQTGKAYFASEQDFKNRFQEKLKAILERQLMGTRTGAVAFVSNSGSSTTVYLYGLDGTLIPENHVLWGHMDPNTKWTIITAATGEVLAEGVTLSAINTTLASATCSQSVNCSGAIGTYALRPYAAVSGATVLVTQMDGLLDVISSAAAYLADQDGNPLSSATNHNWKSLITNFSGADLTPSVAARLVSNCWGDKKGLVFVADPMVLAKAMDNAAAKFTFTRDYDDKLNYWRIFIHTGSDYVQIWGSEWRRNTGYIEGVNTEYLGMLGTILEPKFLRPDLQLLEDSYYYIQDMELSGQFFTTYRHAHTRGTGLAKASY